MVKIEPTLCKRMRYWPSAGNKIAFAKLAIGRSFLFCGSLFIKSKLPDAKEYVKNGHAMGVALNVDSGELELFGLNVSVQTCSLLCRVNPKRPWWQFWK